MITPVNFATSATGRASSYIHRMSVRDGGPQLLSVVAPVYNEEESIAEFHRRVVDALDGVPFELLLVNDGSSDHSADRLAELAASDSRVGVINLSRNFGHQAAITAGLDAAEGDVVVMLDADLQDPPELIPEMVERWRDGADVVYAVRTERPGETRLKLATANWFYRLFARTSGMGLENNSGDFRLFDRRPLDALLALRERSRFLRGLSVWVGFQQASVEYQRDRRYAGETKFSFAKMLRFAFDAITSFSHAPLQAATVFGFVISAAAFLAIPVAIGFKVFDAWVPGVTTVLISVLLLGGIQLITIGVIGEYLGRVYDEVKGRPLYVVDEAINVRSRDAAGDPDRERVGAR